MIIASSGESHAGLGGYFFNPVTAGSGSGAKLAAFESRVAGVGPQIGWLVPVHGMQAFIGLKGYKEFAAQNRASGWNLWLTFSGSPAPPAAAGIR